MYLDLGKLEGEKEFEEARIQKIDEERHAHEQDNLVFFSHASAVFVLLAFSSFLMINPTARTQLRTIFN